VSELALDDVQWHAFAQELERVRVTQLVGREAPANAGPGSATAQRGARRRCVPCPSAGAPVDDAEQRTDWHLLARLQPRLKLLKTPVVHTDLAPAAALAARHKHRATPSVKVEFGQIQRFLDAQPSAPEHDDQAARSRTVQPVAAAAHDRDDLFRARRVRRVPATFAARWATCEIARHGGRRPASTERVQRR
jgi:hypothetical protein